MVNPIWFIILAVGIALITLSPAQIRFALENPLTTPTVFLNLAIIVAFVLTYFHYRDRANNNKEFKLVGSKGGKATKIKRETKKRK